jgi:hypothetical protein
MWQSKYVYLILIVLCFLIYANSLNNAFVSDDITAILKYPLISRLFSFWLDPSTFLSSLNYLIGKFNPFVYHLTNIILHSLNTILVFFFLRLFFKSEASFIGACLFTAHPIHTEAVTWISGRGYLTLSLFILGTYLLYENATGKSKGFKISHYLLCLLLFSYFIIQHLSFYFLVPLFLILSDVTFGRWRKNWKWWIPFFIILILRLILARSLVSQRVLQVAKEIGSGVTWTNPIFNMVYSVFLSLGLILWPAKLTLYHEPAVISSFALKVGIATLLLLACALPFIFKKAKEIFLAIIIFILFLAPTYSPVMISWLVAERYLYFPSIVFSIITSFAYDRYVIPMRNVSQKNLILGFFVFFIAGYAVRTVARNEDWKSPERFWRQTVLVSYNSPRAHNNMGDIYSQEGNVEGAIKEFKRAIELKPNYADVYHNLATTYYRKGDLKEAVKLYQQATSFNPELFESHFNLGIIYLDTGELDLAIKEFQKATQIRPEDVNARQALEMAIKRKGAK